MAIPNKATGYGNNSTARNVFRLTFSTALGAGLVSLGLLALGLAAVLRPVSLALLFGAYTFLAWRRLGHPL